MSGAPGEERVGTIGTMIRFQGRGLVFEKAQRLK